MRRYALRDDQWDRIKDLLPGRDGHVGVTARDNRLFVEAVLFRYRAGIPWRDLPQRFGEWKKVHTRHSRWARSGVCEKVFKALAADAGLGAFLPLHSMTDNQELALTTRSRQDHRVEYCAAK